MTPITIRPVPDRSIAEDLAAWGKVALLETRGRRTGRPVVAAVGFAERPEGAIVVAAGSPDADWALNLLAEPRCRIREGGPPGTYTARELDGAERSAAVRDLILKYGTPSERLGAGPVFELTRTAASE
jgi:deazaflavin-dependent oxidoreductase (nitroreductase family)